MLPNLQKLGILILLVALGLPGVAFGQNPGLDGSSIRTLAIDPSTPTTIYAGLRGGFIGKSIDGGATWERIDTERTNNAVTQVVVASSSTLYMSGFSLGFRIYVSGDAGLSWSNPVDDCDGTAGGCSALGFPALAIDSSGTLYAGARGGAAGPGIGSSNGVFIATNGAANFVSTNSPGRIMTDIAIDPDTETTMYAGTSNFGIYKSTDGGMNWFESSNGISPANFNVRMIAIDPSSTSTVYVGGGGAVFKSVDGGASFADVSNELGNLFVDSLVMDPMDSDTLYVGSNLQPAGGLYKTIDGGASWSLSNTGLVKNDVVPVIQTMAIDPQNSSTIYAGTNNGVYRSDDGGANWKTPPDPMEPPAEPEDGLTGGNQRNKGSTDDPVNTFTGELFDTYPADLDLGGPMPLFYQRDYASYLRRNGVLGDLGSNWRHNFDASLSLIGNAATYLAHDGRETDFVQDVVTDIWSQQNSFDTPYQLVTGAGEDAVLYDPTVGLVYTFDLTTDVIISGKLTKIEDGKGNVHTLTYNDPTNNQLVSVSDGLGRTLTFFYNGDAMPKISVVSDGSRSVIFEYTDAIDPEYLTVFTDARGGITTYTYKDTSADADHALMQIMSRPRGNTHFIQTFYDASSPSSGRVATQTDSDGNIHELNYDGLDTTLTDPDGKTRVHSHTPTGQFNNREDETGKSFSMGADATGRRNSITDRMGDTTSYTYHAPSGKMASVTFADGTMSSFDYAAREFGDVMFYDAVSITHPDGSVETFAYDAAGNQISHTDQTGDVETASFNAQGQPLTETNYAGGLTTYEYNADGTAASVVDPAGNTTTFGYDVLRRRILTTYANGTTSSETYDDQDRALTSTDENGNVETYTYDANGKLATSADPLAAPTTFSYDGNDRLIGAIDSLGNAIARTYDALGRLETTTDENGNTTIWGYDVQGRLETLTNPVGNTKTSTYDDEGVLASEVDALGNTTTYTSDSLGRITRTTSQLGYATQATYDVMGRIATAIDALGNVTTIERDAQGFFTGLILADGAISSSYARDALGNITTTTDPNGNQWLSTYDNLGRRTSGSDPLGNVTMVAFDNRNRPSLVTLPMGTQELTYDGVGNLTRSLFSDGTDLNYDYDEINRLISADGFTQAYDIHDRIVDSNGIAIERDAGGRITSMTLALGKAVTYAYDANSRLAQVTDWLGGITTFTHDAADRLTGIDRPNGIDTTYGYDADGRLVEIAEGDASGIVLTRDGKGQITEATRTGLAILAVPNPDLTNSFDAASQVDGFTYDDLGRLTSDDARTYVWDLASRLTSYTEGGNPVDFTYDAIGQRLTRTSAGATRTYVWNRALSLPSVSIELSGDADLHYYVHAPSGKLLFRVVADTGDRQFYHFDEMGNTRFVTDDAGDLIASYAYAMYGKRIASTGALDNRFTWQGEAGVMDELNQLYHMRARDYDSATGRFLSRDLVESSDPRAINPYQYASGNPLLLIDPSGNQSKERLRDKLIDASIDKSRRTKDKVRPVKVRKDTAERLYNDAAKRERNAESLLDYRERLLKIKSTPARRALRERAVEHVRRRSAQTREARSKLEAAKAELDAAEAKYEKAEANIDAVRKGVKAERARDLQTREIRAHEAVRRSINPPPGSGEEIESVLPELGGWVGPQKREANVLHDPPVVP